MNNTVKDTINPNEETIEDKQSFEKASNKIGTTSDNENDIEKIEQVLANNNIQNGKPKTMAIKNTKCS